MSTTEPTLAVEMIQNHSLSSNQSDENSQSTRKRAFAPITDEDLMKFDRERLQTELNEESYQEERMKQFAGSVQAHCTHKPKFQQKMDAYLKQAASERDSQVRLINHVEDCFKHSTMKGYVFPKKDGRLKTKSGNGWRKGLELDLENPESDQDASLESLKGALVYDLHLQNEKGKSESQLIVPKKQMIAPSPEVEPGVVYEPPAVAAPGHKVSQPGSIRNFLQKLDLRGFGEGIQHQVSAVDEYRLGSKKTDSKLNTGRHEATKQAKASQVQTAHNSMNSNLDPGSSTSRGKRVKYRGNPDERQTLNGAQTAKSSTKALNQTPKRPVLREFMQKFCERRDNKERTTHPSKLNLLTALTNKRPALGSGFKKAETHDRSKESTAGFKTHREEGSKEGLQLQTGTNKPRNRMDAFLKYLKDPKSQLKRNSSKNSTTLVNKSVTRAPSTHRSGAASVIELGKPAKQPMAFHQSIGTPFKNWNNLVTGQIMQKPVSHRSFANFPSRPRFDYSSELRTAPKLQDSQWMTGPDRSKSPIQPLTKKRTLKSSLIDSAAKRSSPSKRIKRDNTSLHFEPGTMASPPTVGMKAISPSILAALKSLPFKHKQSAASAKSAQNTKVPRSMKTSRSALLAGTTAQPTGVVADRRRDCSPPTTGLQPKKHLTKITSITKLTINNQNAYMTFEGLVPPSAGGGVQQQAKPPKTAR